MLLVHGGAWAIPLAEQAAHAAGVRGALEAGWAVLKRGGAAVDAVEAAVTVMEDDATFDAGRGSFLTADGRVQLDALLMDGGRMKAGGVACVERLRNPIQAARLVLEESPHVYFVGAGAEEFARAAWDGADRQLRAGAGARAGTAGCGQGARAARGSGMRRSQGCGTIRSGRRGGRQADREQGTEKGLGTRDERLRGSNRTTLWVRWRWMQAAIWRRRLRRAGR